MIVFDGPRRPLRHGFTTMRRRLAPAVLVLLALSGCGGSSTDIEVVMDTSAIDRPSVDRALDEFRNVCRPLFVRHAGDVTGIRATVSDEPSTQVRRLGWAGHIEITVSLRRSPVTLPQPTEATARFLMGGGERPGILAFSSTAAALCDQPLAEGRQQAFLPAPGLADYLGRRVLNPTDAQVRMWHEEVDRAMAGDYQSQRNVAWCYVDGCYGVEPIDDGKACIWRMIIAAAKHPKSDASDQENVETDCRQALSPEDVVEATARARVLFKKIYGRDMP